MNRTALIEAFAAGAVAVRDAWQRVPTEARRFRPAPGEWSPHELVIHLADADANGYLRFRKLVAEPGSIVPGYEQDAWAESLDYRGQDPDLAIDLMEHLRALTHPILASLADEIWAHSVTHSEVGRWTLEDWLRTYTRHVDDHLNQMEAAVSAWRQHEPPDESHATA